MNNIKRLVIADDLTGANDTGVHFLLENEPVTVIANPDSENESIGTIDAGTVVVNTNSRFFTPKKAYLEVYGCMQKYLALKPNEIYKKIDSTLRGNIGAEIDAVMEVSGFKIACIVPAAPRNGRKTLNGRCYINDVPLDQTEIAKDPFTPVKTANISRIVSSQTSREVGLLPLDVIRSAESTAKRYLQQLISSGKEIIVVDSESIGDLIAVEKLFRHLDEKILYVGSAGLFHAIGSSDEEIRRIGIEKSESDPIGILLVVGSLMDTSIRQAEWFCGNNKNCISRKISTVNVLKAAAHEIKKIVSELTADLTLKNIGLIRTEKDQISAKDNSSRIGKALGSIVRKVLNTASVDVLFATGGDTALYILNELEVSRLNLIDELLPGIPIAEIIVPGKTEPILFISKAGSYGEENALECVVDYVLRENTSGVNK
ncbi:MAG: four-carbon acid sugar kinase family protein [Spirochaetaceae bacterium]|nr:four-carbon acid sugar kinase family protein [Spirochaetaceae bacterium]MCF7939455.1 four-carbon acid sugar kinase family protein [Spirochaetales bacterium]